MAKAEEPAPPKMPLFFVMSLKKQQVSVYSPDGLYAQSPISTGQPGHPTPRGIFTILSKELYHESNIYSGAPMPFMQRITYTGVAMHEGVLPGYPASHGCIRMPHAFAERLYRITAGNERVVISQEDIVPAEIVHPRLPAAKFMAAGRGDAIFTASARPGEGENAPAGSLNPLDFAKAMKTRAAEQAEEAEAAAGPARRAADQRASEVRIATIEYRKAESAFTAARERFELADRNSKRVTGDEPMKAAAAARDFAESKLNEAKAVLEAAMRVKTQRDQEAETAARVVKSTDSTRRYAAGAIKTWTRRLAPLSIFISRKTQRLYVRQDYVQVFDIPITIHEPERPIGTHLFIAMPKDTAAGAPDGRLRWFALTLPEGAASEDEAEGRRGGRVNVSAPAAVAPPTASDALDRIEIPQAVADKLSEMSWAGAGFIISDREMSRETTDFAKTDFVVVTGGQSSSHHRAETGFWGERAGPGSRGGRSFFDLFR